MRNYELNTTAAKEANSGGKRITEPGAYVGHFRAAWHEVNDKRTESVNLIFVSDSEQEVGPLVLYTHKGDGTELPSLKTLNALMACMKLRNLTAKPGPVTIYDFDSKKDVVKEKQTYPELVGPKVGLVLQCEEYESTKTGEIKVRMLIAAPFEAEHRRMATEVLDKVTEPKALERYLQWFYNKPENSFKPLRKQQGHTSASSAAAPANNNPFPDDDIPF